MCIRDRLEIVAAVDGIGCKIGLCTVELDLVLGNICSRIGERAKGDVYKRQILRIRSTSPEKSAWPGVSTMLIFTPL